MEPTKEEEAKLAGHKGDMGSAETFVATILAIPHAFSRIEALLYRETFEDELTHLRKTFSVLEVQSHFLCLPYTFFFIRIVFDP